MNNRPTTTRVQNVNALTGEVLEYTLALLPAKRKNAFPEGWVAMGHNPLETLARANLHGATYSVLFLVLAKLDFENYINLPQTDIAATLGMQKQNVNRAFRQLIDLGVILKGPTVGRTRTYRLNSAFGWKGSAKNHHKDLNDRMKARGLSVAHDATATA